MKAIITRPIVMWRANHYSRSVLRAIFSFMVFIAIVGCTALSEYNEKFVIAGGDGDQAVLGQSLELVRIHPDWFDGKVYRGQDQSFIEDTYLMKVISDGEYHSRLIAITSRWVMSLDDQFQENKYASSIVHLIDSNFDNSKVTSMNSIAVGMAFIDKSE